MSNLKITTDIGLHTDYGIFNLDATVVPENINVDIITNGDLYVNSEETNFQHGENSNYREHEGIKPINNNLADWNRYGSKLAIMLQNYTPNLITSYENGELWESYVKYANQFEVKFDEEKEEDCKSKYLYVSYTNQLIDSNTKKVITYKLSELYTGVNLQAYIIHFSKYYNIYSSTSGSQQVLRPLLYYNADLDTYNMEIKEQTLDSKTIGIPYTNYLIGLEYYRKDGGWHRQEHIRTFIENYNTNNESYEYNNRVTISDAKKDSDAGDHWTQFHTHPHNTSRMPFEDWDNEKWNLFPEGFYVWGLSGNHKYFFNKSNQENTNTTDTFPALYKTIFQADDYKCWRDNDTGGHINGNGNDTLIGIMYRHDRKSNWHIFNTYFPVKSSTGKITQEIKYKSTTSPYPKYIGMILASVLANLYIYGDTPSGNIKYISDIVYLNDHSTIYTKDIAYRVYKSTEKTDNLLLLLHKRPFDSYVKRLKDFVKDTEDLDNKFSDTNVTAIIGECIKNVPLQFKLNYLQPELNTIGEHTSVRVCTIDGQEIDCSSDIVRPNLLYYLDDNNIINFLNKNFKIKWLKSLTKGDDKLVGVWDNTLQPLTNAYLKESINFDEGRFGFNTTEIISTLKGQCYSIVSQNGDYPNYYTDLLINDILVPTARVV